MTSGNYDSSIIIDNPLRCYKPETVEVTEEVNDTSSINVFAQNLPQTQENQVDLSEIDIDELVKKYKKNPFGVIKELGIEFTDQEKAELKAFISDKKSLKSFLRVIKDNEALNHSDIMSAVRTVKKYKPTTNFFKRTGNFFKAIFKEGIGEAIDLAKSETVHYAGKLGKNMNEIRTERTDFSSDTVADVGDTITQQPESKESVMHFVTKSNKDGSKLYTENDVIKARNIIVENIDDADEYTAGVVELESIQDNKGFIKYKGSTIVNVGEKMLKNSEVKSTMLNVAKKSDMTDEHLENTTTNLAKNHNMAEAIDYMVLSKDKNGKDKFTAGDVSGESSYLVDKNKEFCKITAEAIKEISKNQTASKEIILKSAHEAAKTPDKKEEIIAKAATNKFSEIKQEEKTSALNTVKSETVRTKQTSNEVQQTQQSATNPISSASKRNTANNNLSLVNALNIAQVVYHDSDDEIIDKTVINGETYERSEILRELRKKFGVSAEKVLNKIEADSSFIEVMKQYSGNKTIIAALVEDPYLITKIKKVSGSIGVNELADVVMLCTDNTSTNVMLEALQHSTPQEAMLITKKSKIFNLKDDALDILSSSKSTVNKKQQIEELLLNGARNKDFLG